ncbi:MULTISPECIES: TRAP transporter substrate-binding protein DctP [Pacificibacter]|uniref:TRAP transporter substrate-binding protein DctP n=1 Tax=Pacificibacter TaxID=1042323 RepID=UPI001C0A3656|nr:MULTISPECIES: TRAP transporter substrate-binding protein DctP [Pacificibacter]MBU2937786.1 TRAP transporter substrate-binding protein DctP [Pacificibacter marinus]MDO6616047.1 TRAP transporter substrate-binding protein DctP [Pacificibacter sp. 1_MG-2023]
MTLHKKISMSLIASVFALGANLGGAFAQTPIELTLSTYLPPTYEYTWHPIEDFVAEVESKSEGRVKINVFHSGQLFDGYQELGAVSRGDADIVNLTGTYASGTVPAMSIFTLPFLFSDVGHLERALDNGLLDLGITDDLRAQHNTVVLGVGPFDPYQFYSKKSPIVTVDDIKKKVWATTGAMDARSIQLMGGSPTGMSSSELYLSFDRGVIDGTPRPLLTGVGRSLDEVVGYLSLATFGVDTSVLAFNGDKWDSLPADIQEIITTAAQTRDKSQFALVDAFMGEALTDFEAKGMEINQISPEEIENMKAATSTVVEEWLAKVPNGQEYLDLVEATRE